MTTKRSQKDEAKKLAALRKRTLPQLILLTSIFMMVVVGLSALVMLMTRSLRP
jgi:hypothetical protein